MKLRVEYNSLKKRIVSNLDTSPNNLETSGCRQETQPIHGARARHSFGSLSFKRREHDDGWATQTAVALRTGCPAILQIQGHRKKVLLVRQLGDGYGVSASWQLGIGEVLLCCWNNSSGLQKLQGLQYIELFWKTRERSCSCFDLTNFPWTIAWPILTKCKACWLSRWAFYQAVQVPLTHGFRHGPDECDSWSRVNRLVHNYGVIPLKKLWSYSPQKSTK
jgi:hypothetical protein